MRLPEFVSLALFVLAIKERDSSTFAYYVPCSSRPKSRGHSRWATSIFPWKHNGRVQDDVLAPTRLRFSVVDSTTGLEDDGTYFYGDEERILKVYDDWRAEYSRGDFDGVRYQNFRANYITLMTANAAELTVARDMGCPDPVPLSLNEYGDYSPEEFRNLQNGQGVSQMPSESPVSASNDGYNFQQMTQSGGYSGVDEKDRVRQTYKEWCANNGKMYSEARLDIFASNLRVVESYFQETGKTAELNQYADVSPEEYEQLVMSEQQNTSGQPDYHNPHLGNMSTCRQTSPATLYQYYDENEVERIRQAYLTWCGEFGKEYDESRLDIFAANFFAIENYRTQTGKNVRLNAYADLSPDEYNSIVSSGLGTPTNDRNMDTESAAKNGSQDYGGDGGDVPVLNSSTNNMSSSYLESISDNSSDTTDHRVWSIYTSWCIYYEKTPSEEGFYYFRNKYDVLEKHHRETGEEFTLNEYSDLPDEKYNQEPKPFDAEEEERRRAEEEQRKEALARAEQEKINRMEQAHRMEEERKRAAEQLLAEEARLKAEEEERIKQELARAEKEKNDRMEQARRMEEERKRAEERLLAEEARLKAEEEELRKQEAERLEREEKERIEQARRAEKERIRTEERRLAEEARLREEEEQRKQEAERLERKEKERIEQTRRAEEEGIRAEERRLAEEARLREEEERRKQEEERERIEEARRIEEEQEELVRLEEERKRQEERDRLRKEEEERTKFEEARRRVETARLSEQQEVTAAAKASLEQIQAAAADVEAAEGAVEEIVLDMNDPNLIRLAEERDRLREERIRIEEALKVDRARLNEEKRREEVAKMALAETNRMLEKKLKENEQDFVDEPDPILLPRASYLDAVAKTWVDRTAYLEALQEGRVGVLPSDLNLSQKPIKYATEKQKETRIKESETLINSIWNFMKEDNSGDKTAADNYSKSLIQQADKLIAQASSKSTEVMGEELRYLKKAVDIMRRRNKDDRAADQAMIEAKEWEQIQKGLENEAKRAKKRREHEERLVGEARQKARSLKSERRQHDKRAEEARKEERALQQRNRAVSEAESQSGKVMFAFFSNPFKVGNNVNGTESPNAFSMFGGGKSNVDRDVTLPNSMTQPVKVDNKESWIDSVFGFFAGAEKEDEAPGLGTITLEPAPRKSVFDLFVSPDSIEPTREAGRGSITIGEPETPSIFSFFAKFGNSEKKQKEIDPVRLKKVMDYESKVRVRQEKLSRLKAGRSRILEEKDRKMSRKEARRLQRELDSLAAGNFTSPDRTSNVPQLAKWTRTPDDRITGWIGDSAGGQYKMGTKITTSPMKGKIAKPGITITTVTGSQYRLGMTAPRDSIDSILANRESVPKRNGRISPMESFFGRLFSKENIPSIVEWTQNEDGTITGFVNNKEGFEDGTQITTSPVEQGARKGMVIQTRGGSEYKLMKKKK